MKKFIPIITGLLSFWVIWIIGINLSEESLSDYLFPLIVTGMSIPITFIIILGEKYWDG